MLTKTDFSQIRKIVKEEVQQETRKIVQEETKKIVQKELKPIKADIVNIKSDINVIISLFDREYLDLSKRVKRIENHLDLSPLSAT